MIKTESVKFKGSMDRLKSVMSQRDVFHKYNKKFKTDMKVIARSIKSILNEEVPFDIKKIFLGCDFTIELYFDVKTEHPLYVVLFLRVMGFGNHYWIMIPKSKLNYGMPNIRDYFLNLLKEVNITIQH